MKKLIAILSIIATMVLCLVGCNSISIYEEDVCDSVIKQASATILVDTTEEAIEDVQEDTFEYGKIVYDTQFVKAQKGVEKKMLVRFINENEIEELGDYLIVDGVVYSNPTENEDIDLKKLGFKEFFIDDMPTYDEDTQKIVRYYYDNGTTIHRAWRVVNLTKEELEQVKIIKGV